MATARKTREIPRKYRGNATWSEFFSPRAGIPRKRESQPSWFGSTLKAEWRIDALS